MRISAPCRSDGIRAERNRFGGVEAAADSAHQHDLQLPILLDLAQAVDRLHYRGQRGNADIFRHHSDEAPVPPCMPSISMKSTLSFSAILISSFNRPAPIFRLMGTRQSVASRNSSILITRSSAPITSGCRLGLRKSMPHRNAADSGDLLGNFLAHQLPAQPRLGALADVDLDGVRPLHIVRVEAEPPGQALIDHLWAAARSSGIMPPSPVFVAVPTSAEAFASAILQFFDSAP